MLCVLIACCVSVGLLWLLLTGEVPNKTQVDSLTKELRRRETIPADVVALMNSLPKYVFVLCTVCVSCACLTDLRRNTHPMTQLSIGLMALQPHSKFHHAYHSRVAKGKLWEHALDDTLDIVAKIPMLAAQVRVFYCSCDGVADC